MNKKFGFYCLVVLGSLVQSVHGMLSAFRQPSAADCKRYLQVRFAVAKTFLKASDSAKELEKRICLTPLYKAAAFDAHVKSLTSDDVIAELRFNKVLLDDGTCSMVVDIMRQEAHHPGYLT